MTWRLSVWSSVPYEMVWTYFHSLSSSSDNLSFNASTFSSSRLNTHPSDFWCIFFSLFFLSFSLSFFLSFFLSLFLSLSLSVRLCFFLELLSRELQRRDHASREVFELLLPAETEHLQKSFYYEIKFGTSFDVNEINIVKLCPILPIKLI